MINKENCPFSCYINYYIKDKNYRHGFAIPKSAHLCCKSRVDFMMKLGWFSTDDRVITGYSIFDLSNAIHDFKSLLN